MKPPDLIQPGHPTPKPDCRPPCPAGMGLGQVDPFHSLGCGRGKNLACWSPLRKAQPSLSVPSATPCLMPFGGPSAPGRTGFQCSGLGRGCTFPRGKSHPAPTLPGPSYQGCPPNPRPRMFNLQIYFHHKAVGFESLSLKSKQNTKALPKSLEREGLPAPAVLPRRGAALAKLRLFVFHSVFQNCLFPPFRILLQAFALLLFTQTLSSGQLLTRQAWGLCPWTGTVWGLLGPRVTLPHGGGG